MDIKNKLNLLRKKTTFFKFIILINQLLNRNLVRFITLEDLYGDNLKKQQFLEPEIIATPELKQLPSLRTEIVPLGKELQTENYTTSDVYTTVVDKVLYCPEFEVILTPNRKIISESCLFANLATRQKPSLSWTKVFGIKVEKISGYCSVFRNRRRFAHTLIHNIPRCYLLNQSEYEYSSINEIKLLCSERLTDVENFFIPKLIPSNVRITPVPYGRLYYIEKLIFCSFLCPPLAGYLPSQYLERFRAEFLPRRSSRKNRRIFISREKAHVRHILNEEELFGRLSRFGFEKYFPEDMPVSEQIELFYDAQIVVGTHGAALSNIIFSDKITVLELNPTNALTPFFYYLSKSLGHSHYFWFGNEAKFHINYRVNVQKVMEVLSSVL